jgi:hypothetical protein
MVDMLEAIFLIVTETSSVALNLLSPQTNPVSHLMMPEGGSQKHTQAIQSAG